MRVLTADGAIDLRRPYVWGPGVGGSCPADAAVGIDRGRTSPGAREIVCRLGVVQDFGQAAADAGRIGNVPVSKETLRLLVEGEAAAVARGRNGGAIPAAWTSADAQVRTDAGAVVTRVYAGVDGVMVPMVTAAEKAKRRRDQSVRRQRRSAAGVGNARPLPPARPGADEGFKEVKVGLFYDQAKSRRHAFVTERDHAAFGALLKAHAAQVRFGEADQSISLTDGAKWIAGRICQALVLIKVMLLDFYHLSQHVHAAAKGCFGETPAAAAWAAARLAEFKHAGAGPVLAAIDALGRTVRSPAKRRALRQLRDYVVGRLDMLDYRTALANGWDIGSGPTEAACKTLTLRLKRPGMKWDRDHAGSMMNLIALYESGQGKAYWASAA
ncbi:MAG TPA: hypothetical protein VGD91_13880 [Trebonia sp.]